MKRRTGVYYDSAYMDRALWCWRATFGGRVLRATFQTKPEAVAYLREFCRRRHALTWRRRARSASR